ncbi:MAG: ABC transporter ATP-binding protein [Deltaproteobacteria bacterium]|jgi:putative ABC transport system ATP-binding protein|nr:ABC transporter ATP-binding protein [Deltaproteobacteria bacterium]MBT4638520.1 ABC transporter ATP-binding protein [Deltaproteobacteria bacterium]MBT7712104.1 ABC transporter ATP-binding protein [Deltaproteobacteria bacterium]MBT7891799.1 ABC transporter ATP-binding protein [Deltaproteobacteria bacterium]
MMSELIRLENLDKIYPVGGEDFYALKNVGLSLKEGEFSGLVGPSGSGKTTLLNIIGALDQPSHGRVFTRGADIARIKATEAAKLRLHNFGFIFQTFNLLNVYTVYENVELPLTLLGWSEARKKKAILEALEWVGLTDKIKSRPGKLSGGQCQRVAIARAMVKGPKLVLADEPTANLDSENSHKILKTMEDINRETGTTFLFSTHDQKVIDYLARVITLKDGQIAEDREQIPDP